MRLFSYALRTENILSLSCKVVELPDYDMSFRLALMQQV